MKNHKLYFPYSEYLFSKYGEKVYKLPVNIPVTCPNRLDSHGCSFCSEFGTGFESLDSHISVTNQLRQNRTRIEKKYNAHKFIAYFQNYTNTFLPIKQFELLIREAASQADIVEVAVSTRPDCIRDEYLQVLTSIKKQYKTEITLELGLQTVNYHTLTKINRGHTLAEFIDAVGLIRKYNFDICSHVILNLPWDDGMDVIETAKVLSALRVTTVKAHSLYIAKNTQLCHEYENGTISLCSKEEYLNRLVLFLEYLSPDIAIERLFSRVPESEAVFCNWGTSWWKLRDELMELMERDSRYQGRCCHYLNGAALNKLHSI